MFKKHSLRVALVKDPKSETVQSTSSPRFSNDEIKTVVRNVGLFVLGSAIALKLTDAACEIAVNYAPKQ